MLLPTQSNPATGSATGFALALNANLDALRANDQSVEDRLEACHNALWGKGVIAGSYAGALLSIGTGLAANVAAHQALIGAVVRQTGTHTIAAPDNQATVYLWEFQDGSFSAAENPDNPGTASNPAIQIGTCSTGSGEVTAVDNSARAEIQPAGGFTPIGGIILWSGSVASIPAGWRLCDGTNGTPDLRDRFAIGAGGAYNSGAAGGASTASFSFSGTSATGYAQIADHPEQTVLLTQPSITGGPSETLTLGYDGANVTTSQGVPTPYHTHSLDAISGEVPALAHSDSGHAHGFSGSASGVNVLNPYYALAYIMRVA
jgi:hypothetical protein